MSSLSGAAPADGVVRMVRAGLVTLLALAPFALGLGGLLSGVAGVVGATLGLMLPALMLLVTLGAAWATRRSRPEALAAAVLGSYLLKLVLVIAILVVLRGLGGYDRSSLGGALLIGVAIALVAESFAMVRARVPYVEPRPAPTVCDAPRSSFRQSA